MLDLGPAPQKHYKSDKLVANRALSERADWNSVLSFTVVTSHINSFLKKGVT